MLYRVIRTFIKLFGYYDELSEYYGFYIGDIFFYIEGYGWPLNKEIVAIVNVRTDKTIYSRTKVI